MLDNPILKPLPFEPQEPVELGQCCGCGNEVYDIDECIDYDGDLIHDDVFCLASYMREIGDKVG
ncbi:hypothetical protein HXA31_20325 [Salipaludibacillus agaradhaerens]|jgi:hypothetical protein|uniref:Uncharacterized protein n=1 Tax=Salipaludibacillus agaradhaerens TaxID=76935 RepID=A0A9Q4B1Z2_SALAG|nr:hypothetical protein [Salipaludibacillus agaradhaerens]MCR6096908.1 hypothetical protein [Salipaludibacillus agaradhaerens]MCR6116678.1 hypothetical protein [Salipaludibacillus agaradhaerens]